MLHRGVLFLRLQSTYLLQTILDKRICHIIWFMEQSQNTVDRKIVGQRLMHGQVAFYSLKQAGRLLLINRHGIEQASPGLVKFRCIHQPNSLPIFFRIHLASAFRIRIKLIRTAPGFWPESSAI